MIPIFEQGQGNGIGHSFLTFLSRFIEICEEHLENSRAKSFAFILYNFRDDSTKKVLRNQGGFARLDRLSGRDLSVFYIHSDNKKIINAFNDIFLGAFEIEKKSRLPFVLFFNVTDREVTNVKIVELEQSNILFAFEELYSIIENYIERTKNDSVEKIKPSTNKVTEFLKSVKKIALDRFIKYLFDKGTEYGEQIFF
jgi:hypothetical protein